jgi:hypothetical protein
MMSADCIVLLSDIDGLYTAPPLIDAQARRLDVVKEITPEIEAMAGDAGSELSRGGMVTKLVAAKIAVAAGGNLVIANGKILHPLRALAEGAPCTWFLASTNPVVSRKRWIAGALEPRGTVTIDDGARAALNGGRSLLPAGIVKVEGAFDRGDAVIIKDLRGQELGRGLVAYARADAEQLIGRKSALPPPLGCSTAASARRTSGSSCTTSPARTRPPTAARRASPRRRATTMRAIPAPSRPSPHRPPRSPRRPSPPHPPSAGPRRRPSRPRLPRPRSPRPAPAPSRRS